MAAGVSIWRREGKRVMRREIMYRGSFSTRWACVPALGRTFTMADDRRGCPGTAVLSYGFWQREYGGRADVVGKNISLDNHPFEILGVLEPGFTGIDVGNEMDLYIPICAEKIIRGENSCWTMRSSWWLRVIGRPKPGISASQATARLKTLAPAVFEATVPPNWKPDEQEYRKHTFDTQPAANGLSFDPQAVSAGAYGADGDRRAWCC